MAIPACNKLYFSKTKDTPWYQNPLQQIRIHNGYDLFKNTKNIPINKSPNAFLETTIMLSIMCQEYSKQHKKWEVTTTFTEILQGLSKQKEATSTSPSDRHLGIYKALLTIFNNYNNEFNAKDNNGIKTHQKAEAIL